jgi:hypothetical protein
MLDHTLDSGNGILHLRPKAALQESDFAELASVVDPYLEGHGELKGVIVEAPEGFPGWSSFAAMTAHLRFVRDHHRRIRKIAIVTDTHLADVAEKLGSHFIAATIKHFPSGQVAEAERWILGA